MTPLGTDPTARTTFDRALDLAERLAAAPAKPAVDLEAPPPRPTAGEQASLLRFVTTATDPKVAAIDAFLERARATYTFRDASGAQQTAAVFPQFRMRHGFNDAAAKKDLPEALPRRTPALDQAINAMTNGVATPAQVARVTQALIDAGHLDLKANGDPMMAIRAMQWKYGVGLDCARYVQLGFMTCRGLDPLSPTARATFGFAPALGDEGLGGVATSGKFRTIDAASCKPGDLMILGPPSGQQVGHTLLVRSNTPLDAASRANLLARNGDPAARALLAGDVRVVEVDSSWGGGEEGIGGVARQTWLYDATTRRWATWGGDGLVTPSTADGPYDHPMTGVFRPKGEP